MNTDQRYEQAGMRAPRGSAAFPSQEWTVADLRSYADEHEIDLAGATLKADILAAVTRPPIDPSDPFLERVHDPATDGPVLPDLPATAYGPDSVPLDTPDANTTEEPS